MAKSIIFKQFIRRKLLLIWHKNYITFFYANKLQMCIKHVHLSSGYVCNLPSDWSLFHPILSYLRWLRIVIEDAQIFTTAKLVFEHLTALKLT